MDLFEGQMFNFGEATQQFLLTQQLLSKFKIILSIH